MSQVLEQQPQGFVGKSRDLLLRRLIDYVALPASIVTPQERSMGGDILLDMMFHASENERRMCAERLSNMREAPRRLLRYLAQCSFDIAEPLLAENEAFDASDLVQMIEPVTAEHRLAIAERKIVEAVVADKLAEVGELPVLFALLRNKAAELSETALDTLVARSREAPELCEEIIKRLELKPAQAMAMFWWSNGPTRRLILQRQAAERSEMVDMCSDIFAIAASENWQDSVTRKTLQLIERRQRNRAAIDKSPYDSLEDAIVQAEKHGLTPEITQEIGYLAGIKPITIAKIMTDKGGESLAVMCKATGLKAPYLELLWLATERKILLAGGKRNPAYDYVVESYHLLSVAKAQTTLRYWNWSLSSTFSPATFDKQGVDKEEANDEQAFSAAQRTVRLVFGQ